MASSFLSDDGNIQMYLGDSYDHIGAVRNLPVKLLLTDPPYGIEQDPDKFGESGFVAVHDDDKPFDPRPWLDLGFPTCLWGANNFSHLIDPETYVPEKMKPNGGWLFWDKTIENAVEVKISDGELAWTNLFRGVRGFRHLWSGAYRASEPKFHVHPTQKPVALMKWILEMFTEPGDLVFDPFMGSGPVAQACYEMQRQYYGVEINPDHFETATKRCSVLTIFGDQS